MGKMTASSTASPIDLLREAFPDEILEVSEEKGERAVVIRKDRCHEILRFLKEDPGLSFEMLTDLCGADYLPMGLKPRFEAVYHLYSLSRNRRLSLRVKEPEEAPALPTATGP